MQPRARIFSNISTPFSRGKSPTFRLYCIFEFMNDLHFHCVFSLTHCTQIVPILPFFLAYSYILLLHWVYMVWRLHFPFLQIIGDTNVMGSDGVWGREVIERGSEKRKKIKGLCFCMKNERGRKIWQVESANDRSWMYISTATRRYDLEIMWFGDDGKRHFNGNFYVTQVFTFGKCMRRKF